MILFIFLALALTCATATAQSPAQEGLLDLWQSVMQSDGAELTEKPNGRYHLVDPDLPYDGELELIGTNIRRIEMAGETGQFTHSGYVEFSLTELTEPLQHSQIYYLWAADRQQFYYDEATDRWGKSTDFWTPAAPNEPTSKLLAIALDWWPLALLAGAFFFFWKVIQAANRQQKRTRSLIDDSVEINAMAKENLKNAKAMQDEHIAIARKNAALVEDNNALLRELVQELKRK